MKKRSKILCHSSASTCSARSIEPFTSAKRTVTCFRSPSRALREVRIFSARWRGVYDRGVGVGDLKAGDVGRALPINGAAHSLQNLAPAGFAAPQAGHGIGKGEAQSLQNFAPSRFSFPHDGQRIAWS